MYIDYPHVYELPPLYGPPPPPAFVRRHIQAARVKRARKAPSTVPPMVLAWLSMYGYDKRKPADAVKMLCMIAAAVERRKSLDAAQEEQRRVGNSVAAQLIANHQAEYDALMRVELKKKAEAIQAAKKKNSK